MNTLNTEEQICTDTLKLLGDFWSLRIISALASDALRFNELQRTIDNCNPATLTERLKRLEEAGLLQRTEESVDKISVTYGLTKLGHMAMPIINAYNDFALKAKTVKA